MVTSNYVTKITLTIQGSRRNAAFFMRIIETQLDYDDVLILPNRSTISSRKEVDLDRTFKFYYSPKEWTGIPIITANMPCLGIESVAEILRSYKIITCLHKYYTVQEILDILWNQGTEYTWISIGLNEQDKIRQLAGIEPNIVIDVPNGYMSSFPDYCKEIRELSPNSIITCGNVCTLEMAQELILHGKVDLVKIGIGNGASCSTRLMTGCGRPQLSTIIDCAQVHGLKSEDHRLGLIMADGGIRHPGDIAKAFCAGSDFVMIGSLFAGAEETGLSSDWSKDIFGNKKQLKFYGMSTHHAQEKHGQGKKDYRASEGRIRMIPNKGTLDSLVQEVLGGLRSCGAFIGARSLKEFSRCATFCKVNRVHFDTNYSIGE